jgi:hypothetical protein
MRRRRRDTEDAPRRIWGGAWLDFIMVAAAFLLVLTLGLFPAQLGPARNDADDVARAQASTPAKPGPAAKAADARRPSPRKAVESKDKYDALREAWGG